MRSWRIWLLLAVGAGLALLALAAPIVSKGLSQRRIAAEIGMRGGGVAYDCNSVRGAASWSPRGIRNRLASWIGPEFVGNIDTVSIGVEAMGVTSRNDPALERLLVEMIAHCRDLNALRSFAVISGPIDDAVVEQIGQLRSPSLRGLGLVGAIADDFWPLANLQSLESVSLIEARQITPATIEVLSKLPALEDLHLSGSNIEPGALAGLRNCQELRLLILTGVKMSVEDLAVLSGVPQLKQVIFDSKSFSQDEIDEIQAMLPKLNVSQVAQ